MARKFWSEVQPRLLGPIFAREWLTLPRRGRHYALRTAYLGFLWVLALTAWQALVGWQRAAGLAETARFGQLLFTVLAYLQLTLLLFFAALSAASAVALEKDRQTLDLLLLTTLRNHEIVLGKLFGSLLQLAVLLLSALPLLALLVLLGGIDPVQVLLATLVPASAILAAGSLGTVTAFWRERTFPSLAFTVLFLVLYLSLGQSLDFLAAQPGENGEPRRLGAVDWELAQAWLDPYRALARALDPDARKSPVFGFAGVGVALAALLNFWGIARLRAWNPPRTASRRAADRAEDEGARKPVVPGRSRRIWTNPVLWREVRTRAYGRRTLLIKLGYFVAVGLIAGFALAPVLTADEPVPFAAARGLVPITILSLLLAGAQAVTAIGSERDSGALQLLLVTDLTPREFIFGKLLGILWNTKEYLLPPLVLAGVYAGLGLLATPPRNHPELADWKNLEAAVAAIGGLTVLSAFTIVLGVHIALRAENSRLAILHALGTVFFLSAGTLLCTYLIIISGRFEYQWGAFVFFALVGIGGLWWVLSGDRPSPALTLASWLCPLAVLYAVMNILVAKPGSEESADPLWPLVAIAGAFGFAIAAMLVPLVSEFDVALGRTSAAEGAKSVT